MKIDSDAKTGGHPRVGITVRCHTAPDADPLDQELALRLNERLEADADGADYLRTLRPAINEALGWLAATTLFAVLALWWLV